MGSHGSQWAIDYAYGQDVILMNLCLANLYVNCHMLSKCNPFSKRHLDVNNASNLHLRGRCTRDVEPLVNAGVDGRWRLALARWDVEGVGVGAFGRVRDGGVDQAEVLLGGFAGGKLLPGLSTLTDNVHGVLPVLALSRESELVLRLAVWDLVDAEPLVRRTEQTGQVALDVLDVVELGSQRVVHIDDHNLPVGLSLVEQCHDTKDLDLDNIAGLVDKLADLTDVQWVIVAFRLGLLMCDIGVLPRLPQPSAFAFSDIGIAPSHLREGSVVPEVALVWEAVPHKAKLALLGGGIGVGWRTSVCDQCVFLTCGLTCAWRAAVAIDRYPICRLPLQT